MKLVILATLALALPAHADSVRHVPPGDAVAGAAISLIADAPATTPTLVAHVRTTGELQYHPVELVRRDDARWVAVIPAVAPGLDYFLDAGGQPVFASAEAPHTVAVHVPAELERKSRDLTRNVGRRSRIHTFAEYVDWGTPTVNGAKIDDHYYRIDADFTYRLMAYPLEELRVGYSRLLGTEGANCPGEPPCTTGFKVGGWFELGLAPIEGIRFDGRVMMMATAAGFNFGGRGEARIGSIDGSHVALGFEHMADVGTAGYFRLGWGTVPHTPMAATVEISDLPTSSNSTGVRLFYDVARDFGGGLRIGVRVGYAARVASVAGITGGAGVTVDF